MLVKFFLFSSRALIYLLFVGLVNLFKVSVRQ